MTIHIRPITHKNRAQAFSLTLAASQTRYCESVAQCLKEADALDVWRPVGLYATDMLVGFAMYGYFEEEYPTGRVWLDRLLIDQSQQGKGYGKAALHALLSQLYQVYGHTRIYLSVIDPHISAVSLYKRAGFYFTGEADLNGEYIMQRDAR